MYNHTEKSKFTAEDCEKAVGKTASLPLTGTIVDSGVSNGGPYVRFEPDERWGLLPGTLMTFDLDAFVVDEA